jgi:hypothetical protein
MTRSISWQKPQFTVLRISESFCASVPGMLRHQSTLVS